MHNAEVRFKGETTLDNGLTVGAQIELEGENAGDQIDKSFVYWSGGFGRVSDRFAGRPDRRYARCSPGSDRELLRLLAGLAGLERSDRLQLGLH